MGGDEKRASASKDAETKAEPIPAGESPIQNQYSFWYIKRSTGSKAESYEKSIKEIGKFNTVQGFWRLYNHLMRPNDLPNTMDYHLFKTGIKPMWEDSANRRGGKWMVRLRKGIASRYWEDLVLAIIGEQFDVGNEICGAVISVRYNEDIISLWNRNADNEAALQTIRKTLEKVLNLPHFASIEYKRHDMSLSDNTSFRNTTLWRSEVGKGEGGGGGGGGSRENQGQRHHHRTSGGSNQKDGAPSTRGEGRYSRDKLDKQASGGGSGQSRSGWRDGGSNNSKSRSFYKSSSGAGGDDHGASERSSSSDRPNAWQQK